MTAIFNQQTSTHLDKAYKRTERFFDSKKKKTLRKNNKPVYVTHLTTIHIVFHLINTTLHIIIIIIIIIPINYKEKNEKNEREKHHIHTMNFNCLLHRATSAIEKSLVEERDFVVDLLLTLSL